jgi:hypothetical protein
MNNILNYPIPTSRRPHEETFLFGLIGLLIVVGILYYGLYVALYHIVTPSSQIEEIPRVRTILV